MAQAAAALKPDYTPAGPSRDLVPAQPHLLIAIDHFLTASECSKLIVAAHSLNLQPPSAADLNPRKNEAYLNRESTSFVDASFAELLWRRLRHLPNIDGGRVPIGLYADSSKKEACKFKFYRYAKGMRFDQHVDQSWKGINPGEETEYTLLIYLNSADEQVDGWCDQPLVGGDTVFMATAKTELCRASPSAGMALLHAHGRRCLMHYGEEVSRGEKYVLRADVMYRRGEAQAAPASEAAAASGGGAGGGKKKGKKK